ncbi:MAG: hypothetical protein LBN11_01965, partial [Tannerella sp.]|nr:hypothetical protein [Tannerella sp.]
MLGAALFVGCNNESPINPDLDGDGINDGISTHATFSLKFTTPTYAHDNASMTASAQENAVDDVALFIYKADGTPEAMIYATNTQFTTGTTGINSPATNQGKITVKCKSGDKLIYLAANLGATSAGGEYTSSLVDFDYNGAAHADPWLGVDWE